MMHEDIRNVLNAVRILSKSEYTINDTRRDIERIKITSSESVDLFLTNDGITQGDITGLMYKVLSTDIYNTLYNLNDKPEPCLEEIGSNFLTRLSNANSGVGGWENGWRVLFQNEKSGHFAVQKGKVQFWVMEDEVDVSGEGEKSCLVRIPKELKFLHPYFYMAFGNAKPSRGSRGLVRFYWNLTPSSSPSYIKGITHCLNEAGIYFKTKVLSDPEKYTRSDSGVLYLEKESLRAALPHVLKVYHSISNSVNKGIPLFTRKIKDGLSFAEDTTDDQSFGFSRSSLIAKSIIGHCQMRSSGPSLEEYVSRIFQEQGIDPSTPYAVKDSLNEYESILNECH
ncbi:MAG TPA: T3SS effector HopA1 family protein [Gallionella sp.]|nr:T3SS effector HopA1 family protein [Gallionella sp.]